MPSLSIFTKGYRSLLPSSNEDEDQSLAEAKIHRFVFWMLAVNMALLSLCLLALLLLLLKVNGIERSPESRLSSTSSVAFTTHLGRDMAFMTLDHESDSLWDVMLAEYLGQFETPDDQYKRGEYSMFHQLRCLARFRLAMQQASEGRNIGKDFRDDHWAHCLDYMRRVRQHCEQFYSHADREYGQIVLCNADMTIERPRIALQQPDGTVRMGIEGAEDMRLCRPIQPMCDKLAARGIAKELCVPELNSTLLPWGAKE